MVSETLDRRQLQAERLQKVKEQLESLERLRSQRLPDGRTLVEVDRDGSLFDTLHALLPVVRKHENFKLDLTTDEGVRLRVVHVAGALGVEVHQERRVPSEQEMVVDLREQELDIRNPGFGAQDSALDAALRRQAGNGA